MSSIALRRPRPAPPRRVSGRHDSISPSTVTPLRPFPAHRAHATADFTEADEDEDEDEDDGFNHNNNSNNNNTRNDSGRFDDSNNNNNNSNSNSNSNGNGSNNTRRRRAYTTDMPPEGVRGQDQEDDDDDGEEERQPRRRNTLPVLPLFSSSHLGMIFRLTSWLYEPSTSIPKTD